MGVDALWSPDSASVTVICTSSTRPSVPAEGQHIYETDTDKEYTYTGLVWVCTAYNGAWDSWTPIPTINSTNQVGTLAGRSKKIGRHVLSQGQWLLSGALTAGAGALGMTLPYTAETPSTWNGGLIDYLQIIGTVYAYNPSTNQTAAGIITTEAAGGTTGTIRPMNGNAGVGSTVNSWTTAIPWTWASTHMIHFHLDYLSTS